MLASPIDWTIVEDGLHDWFNNATGLVTIWSNQGAPQPPYPYASLNIIAGPVVEGGADEIRTETDLGQPAGEEVEICAVGFRLLTVSCQVRTTNAASPTDHARHFMSIAQSALGLPSVIQALDDAGIAIVDQGDITDISLPIKDSIIAVSTMSPVFRVASNISERTGFIKQVELSSNGLGNSDFTDELFGDLS